MRGDVLQQFQKMDAVHLYTDTQPGPTEGNLTEIDGLLINGVCVRVCLVNAMCFA